MKKIIIASLAALVGVGVGTAVYINKSRQKKVVKSFDNFDYVRDETFKEAAIRKVNEILSWAGDHQESLQNFVSLVSTVSTVIGLVSSVITMYQKTKELLTFRKLLENKEVLV